MNKKGVISGLPMHYLVYFLIMFAFFIGVAFYVLNMSKAAEYWEENYAYQIVRAINSGEPGDSFSIDIFFPSKIAKSNGVQVSQTFSFDNRNRKVIVRLSSGERKEMSFVNDVIVGEWEIRQGIPGNALYFKLESPGGKG